MPEPQRPQDGGQAFPVPNQDAPPIRGMSLRDYFAAAALQGLLAKYSDVRAIDFDNSGTVTAGDFFSKAAYGYADCMLKAREGR